LIKKTISSFLIYTTISILLSYIFTQNAHANPKYSSLVINADTGVILHQNEAGKSRYPASLVKIMTLYLTFQAIENGKLSMDSKLKVSAKAAAQAPSKLGLREGSHIAVKDAILALIIKSANDIAVVLAESIEGTEAQFAKKMTATAKKLGMNHTNFVNASGLHNQKQVTTAFDMARLAVALRRDYPTYYPLFNTSKFVYNGAVYTSHNRVTKTYRGADGLKTGFINASGFNLVTSASRNGNNIIGVVFGGQTTKRRDQQMVKLLDKAFYNLSNGTTDNDKVYNDVNVPVPRIKPRAKLQASSPEPQFRPEATSKIIEANAEFNS
jgi:D-alanyl-D-alanine carboxypeptidase